MREWRTVQERNRYFVEPGLQFGLGSNHRPNVRSLPQKPQTRELKLNPYSTYNIEPYKSRDDLATIHFSDEQISTQNLALLHHSQFHHTVHETLNLMKQFWLYDSGREGGYHFSSNLLDFRSDTLEEANRMFRLSFAKNRHQRIHYDGHLVIPHFLHHRSQMDANVSQVKWLRNHSFGNPRSS